MSDDRLEEERELIRKLDAGVGRISDALRFAPGGADFDMMVQGIEALVAERDTARAEAASLSSLLAANSDAYSTQRDELAALADSLAAVRLERDRWEVEARRARAEEAKLRAAGDPGADKP